MKQALLAGATAFCLMLTACGGGGSSGGSTAGGASPAPTPAPTPAPAATVSPATLPPAPFGLTASREFTPFGWFYPDGSNEPAELTAATFSVSYIMGDTYRVTLPQVGSGRLVYASPGSPNQNAFNLIAADGSAFPLRVTLDDTRFYDIDQRNVGFIVWGRPNDEYPPFQGSAIFGQLTDGNALPTTGSKGYLTFKQDGATVLLKVDFAAQTVTGYIQVERIDAWGPYPTERYDLVSGTLSRADNTFTANFNVPGAPVQGFLRGRFFGPTGAQVGVAWRAPQQDIYSSFPPAPWNLVSGVLVGIDCPECLTAP